MRWTQLKILRVQHRYIDKAFSCLLEPTISAVLVEVQEIFIFQEKTRLAGTAMWDVFATLGVDICSNLKYSKSHFCDILFAFSTIRVSARLLWT